MPCSLNEEEEKQQALKKEIENLKESVKQNENEEKKEQVTSASENKYTQLIENLRKRTLLYKEKQQYNLALAV